jgi:hypothetical protein
VTTLEQALAHESRRRSQLGRLLTFCWMAEAVLVAIAGVWETGQRIHDRRVLNRARR